MRHRAAAALGPSLLAPALAMTFAACGGSDVELFVDLQTDLAPGSQFDHVDTGLFPGEAVSAERRVVVSAGAGDDFGMGRRVAEFSDVARGNYTLRVGLSLAGGIAAERAIVLDVQEDRAVTVIISASDCTECEDGGADSGSLDAGITDAQFEDRALDAAFPDRFSAPTLLGIDSPIGVNDDDPTLTADLLELYFVSTRPGGLGPRAIWVATRERASDPWGTPTLVAELSSASSDVTPEVSPDGLTMWLASNRAGGLGDYDVWMATRFDRHSAWNLPVPVPELSSTEYDCGAAPSWDGMSIVLETQRDAPMVSDLYSATRDSGGAWSTPAALAGVNTGAYSEANGFFGADGTALFFSSERLGNRDIYVATREGTSGAFTDIARIDELATGFIEDDPWVSEDGRYIVFSSNRSGSFKIYEASR